MPCCASRVDRILRACLRAVTAAFVAAALAACGNENATILAASVTPQSGTLDVNLQLALTPTLLDALDHGVPLTLIFKLDMDDGSSSARFRELSYLPMTRRYRLLTDDGTARYFQSRLQLLAALDHVRLPLALPSGSGSVRLYLDTASLPAPLRLPALFDRDWHLAAARYHWTTQQ